jgi:hypothetical protein
MQGVLAIVQCELISLWRWACNGRDVRNIPQTSNKPTHLAVHSETAITNTIGNPTRRDPVISAFRSDVIERVVIQSDFLHTSAYANTQMHDFPEHAEAGAVFHASDFPDASGTSTEITAAPERTAGRTPNKLSETNQWENCFGHPPYEHSVTARPFVLLL